MKKLVALIMVIAMLALMLVGCDILPSKHTLAVGRVVTAKDGETVETVCALVLEKDGRIAFAKIDETQFTEGATSVLSKKALGYDYNMLAYSNPKAIGEWFEQVEYLERALVGKTREEALAMETRSGELVSGCTIAIEPYLAAVAAAFDSENKQDYDMNGDPYLALTVSNKLVDGSFISSVSASTIFRMQTAASIVEINKINIRPAGHDGQ